MPRRTDLQRILLLGSGPIVIGQAAEFDYSGTQAVKALKEEGYTVALVNSNPATIMTDPELADRTYIEPLTPEWVRKVIERERPDALLPTMGGQTALNVAMALAEDGTLERFGVELIGANARAIGMAEDRAQFAAAMRRIGLATPVGRTVATLAAALDAVAEIGYPAVIRPSFTLGGTGGGVAYNRAELEQLVERALALSPLHTTLIERSVLGWKEFELEVMRDARDNVVIVCSIENVDPMGVHTGDSITVAPAMTLTDREYQRLRDAAIAIIREIGVEAGGCNIQFAVNPADGTMLVIEMNPRVSRSSALASKATGFPIARIGTKLAVGYTLDELPNDITRTTPASFEPVLDYVVVKVPRFAFEKFPTADYRLTTQMKSVGEAMAIGRTFKEALQKGLRALETGRPGWAVGATLADDRLTSDAPDDLRVALCTPTPERIFQIKRALAAGLTVEAIAAATGIDPWFLYQMQELLVAERWFADLPQVGAIELRRMKRLGFSDRQLATLRGETEAAVREERWRLGVRPAYKTVDTCAGEFPSATPYLYGSYDEENESEPFGAAGIVILGSGPNRIGQGVEFDYCCVRAALAFRELGYKTIMINSNPETVSTDFDISDKLYFEPLTLEDVLEIVRWERPKGVVVQLGGQTPLALTKPLEAADSRHAARLDRRGRGSGALRGTRPTARHHPAGERHRALRRGGGRGGAADRLSRPGTPVLCAGRAGDGNRVRRSLAARLLRADRPGRPGAPGADRPLLGGRVRGRCGRHRRRAARCDRGRDAAHRGRRRAFGRLGLRAATLSHRRSPGSRDAPLHPGVRRGARRGGADQRPVRHQGRGGLRLGGEPAGFAHRPIRQQGHRGPPRQARRCRDGRPHPGRTGPSR